MKDDPFISALSKLWQEITQGSGSEEAYVLNPGDRGLLGQLRLLTANDASRRPMAGETTIASHVDHVWYGISLATRWAEGEANPWKNADWSASWRRLEVSEDEWRALLDRLEMEVSRWDKALASRTEWHTKSAAGAIGLAAHTAYHLGAIRQIIAALEVERAKAPTQLR